MVKKIKSMKELKKLLEASREAIKLKKEAGKQFYNFRGWHYKQLLEWILGLREDWTLDHIVGAEEE